MNVIIARSSMIWTPNYLVRGLITLNEDTSRKGSKGIRSY